VRFILLCVGAGDELQGHAAETLAAHLRLHLDRHQPPEAVLAADDGCSWTAAQALARAFGLDAPLRRDELSGTDAAPAWSMIAAEKDGRAEDATVLLVCSEAMVRGLVCIALGIPPEDAGRFALEPSSISSIEFRGPRTLIASLNDTCHLEPATNRPPATQGPK